MLKFALWTFCLLKYDEIREYKGGAGSHSLAQGRSPVQCRCIFASIRKSFILLNVVLEFLL